MYMTGGLFAQRALSTDAPLLEGGESVTSDTQEVSSCHHTADVYQCLCACVCEFES